MSPTLIVKKRFKAVFSGHVEPPLLFVVVTDLIDSNDPYSLLFIFPVDLYFQTVFTVNAKRVPAFGPLHFLEI